MVLGTAGLLFQLTLKVMLISELNQVLMLTLETWMTEHCWVGVCVGRVVKTVFLDSYQASSECCT